MGAFLRNRNAMITVVVILTFAAGLAAGLLITLSAKGNTNDGASIDGNELQPGVYDVVYPASSETAVVFHNLLPAEVKATSETLFVLGKTLVTVDSSLIEWKKHPRQNAEGAIVVAPLPEFEVKMIGGKKKFIYTE